MAHPRAYFKNNHPAEFRTALKQRVIAYFRDSGRHPKTHPLMWLKATVFAVAAVVSYLVLLQAHSFWSVFLWMHVFGLVVAIFVVNVAHDASHGAFSRSRPVNKFLAQSWNLIGISTYFWEMKHHLSHHAFTNVVDYDQDISQTEALRLNPVATFRWYHRYQGVYAIGVYLLFGIFGTFIREFRLLTITRFGNKTVKHPPGMLWRILLIKVVYLSVYVVIPWQMSGLSFGLMAIAFLSMITFVGLYLVIILISPHINLGNAFKLVDEHGGIEEDFFVHTLQATTDFSARSWLLNWLTGGLNTHVVHHMFPHICHAYYPALTRIIRSVALEFGEPYKQQSFGALLLNHFRMIRKLADPVTGVRVREIRGILYQAA